MSQKKNAHELKKNAHEPKKKPSHGPIERPRAVVVHAAEQLPEALEPRGAARQAVGLQLRKGVRGGRRRARALTRGPRILRHSKKKSVSK
jgi:hypothetical protein